MKKIVFMIMLIACAGMTTGCYTNVIDAEEWENGGSGGNDEDDPGVVDYALIIFDRSQLEQFLSAEPGSCEVEFEAGTAWRTSLEGGDTEGITITPNSSEQGGRFTLVIFVDENTLGRDRIFHIMLHCGPAIEIITIHQSPELQSFK